MIILLMTLNLYASDLIFTNNSGSTARISELRNKCTGVLVSPSDPVVIENGKSFVLTNVYPVVHTYTVCGSGLCSSSAFGVKDSKTYNLNIFLDSNGYIDVESKPDHWITSNFNCPKETK